MVQWLFLDLNAFFASCEQQENLRGQPVIVVQTPTDSAAAIAASYAAKAFGIKTGTLVREVVSIWDRISPVSIVSPSQYWILAYAGPVVTCSCSPACF